MRQSIRNILFGIVSLFVLYLGLRLVFNGLGIAALIISALAGAVLGVIVHGVTLPTPGAPRGPNLGDWIKQFWRSGKGGRTVIAGTVIGTAILALAGSPAVQSTSNRLLVAAQPTVTKLPQAPATARPARVRPTLTAVPTPTPVPQIILATRINLRQGPSTRFDVLTTLPADTQLLLHAVITFQDEQWYEVNDESATWHGWISGAVVPVEPVVVALLPVSSKQFVLPTAVPQPTVVPPSVPQYRVGAICRDGWRSYSTGRGTCSHHGGVDYWLYGP